AALMSQTTDLRWGRLPISGGCLVPSLGALPDGTGHSRAPYAFKIATCRELVPYCCVLREIFALAAASTYTVCSPTGRWYMGDSIRCSVSSGGWRTPPLW